MPLGIFGGSSKDGGPKPQPLTSEESILKKEKNVGSSSNTPSEIKDTKGSVVKLNKKTYTVERKLAEGGFAIVYLVVDKHNRSYALKRQLIRDDQRQKNLSGHKNIIEYVDHQLVLGKTGVYDYMLLTTYYPDNVLQLMNSRILVNKWLSHNEILDIFCDICEAVENVLIDRGSSKERPIYILCDFGSATTKVLSKEHYSHAFMEEEIQRYTTLSYRAPEMIDLFSGTPIDTKSDIWALGIMLYKLCYFSLPFGESALAIQGGLFSFPEVPQIQDGIKAMINLMLTMSAKHRPNIYQMSYLAFSAAGKKCPVFNVEKCARIELNEAIQILHLRDKLGSNYSRLFEKAINDFEAQKRRHTMPNQTVSKEENQTNIPSTSNETPHPTPSISSKLAEGVIVNTTTKEIGEMHPRSATTSVNPRLRPKPNQVFSTPNQKTTNLTEVDSFVNKSKQIIGNIKGESSTSSQMVEQQTGDEEDLTLHLSAFQPYSLAQEEKKNNNSFKITENTARIFEVSNPFAQQCSSSSDFNNMDDKIFGEHFDAIRRDRVNFQEEDNLIFETNKYCGRISNDFVTECGTSSRNNFSNLSKQVDRDWETIEKRMGDDPFMNAPPILPSQYLHRN
uniref:non-specific serine/threonine protein kinase n=1 Tax=Meloidogyne javanica TaxID=6303 RepID=A0A915MJB6_MELJA